MGLEWVLRAPHRHNHRQAILVDSMVALGGAAKGRSSSWALLRELRKTAALVLGGGLLPYYVYIHTSENPADAPSRGEHRRSRKPKAVIKHDRFLKRRQHGLQRLRDCGMISTDFCSTGSDSASEASQGRTTKA